MRDRIQISLLSAVTCTHTRASCTIRRCPFNVHHVLEVKPSSGSTPPLRGSWNVFELLVYWTLGEPICGFQYPAVGEAEVTEITWRGRVESPHLHPAETSAFRGDRKKLF